MISSQSLQADKMYFLTHSAHTVLRAIYQLHRTVKIVKTG